MAFGGYAKREENRKAEEKERNIQALKKELELVRAKKKNPSNCYMITGDGQFEEKELFKIAVQDIEYVKFTTKMELIFDNCYHGFREKAGFCNGSYALTEKTINGFLDNLYLHKGKPLPVGFIDHFEYWFRSAAEFLEPKITGENRIAELQKLGMCIDETLKTAFVHEDGKLVEDI